MAKYIKTEEGYKTREELNIGKDSADLVLRVNNEHTTIDRLSTADITIEEGSFSTVIKTLSGRGYPRVKLIYPFYVSEYGDQSYAKNILIPYMITSFNASSKLLFHFETKPQDLANSTQYTVVISGNIGTIQSVQVFQR